MALLYNRSDFIRQSQTCAASFDRDLCANCPYQDQCKPKIFKRVARINVSKKSVERAKTQAEMKTDRFKLFYRIRNGVETIPSILKNQFNVNQMPFRGLTRGKFFFGCKVAALNFRKLFNYRKGLGHYAQNPLLG
ncbi:MAG: transposase [Candidatus Weimeria sp.]